MRLLLCLSILLMLIKVRAQYTGGKSDGFALIQPALQNKSVNIYSGAKDDGFASATIKSLNKSPNLYTGGADDGFNSSSASLVNPLPAFYTGSDGDGFAISLVLSANKLPSPYSGGGDDGAAISVNKDQNVLPAIYAGGSDDGFASLNSPKQNVFLNIYTGGANDGYALGAAVQQNKSAKLASLISFSGAWQLEDASLLWQISSPENVETFEIERSINNGQTFESLKKTKPDEKQSGKIMADYTYLDLKAFNIPSVSVKYRIKWMDKTGNLKYSPVVTLTKNSKEPIIAVYPNPTNGSFILQFKSEQTPVNYKYVLYNGAGVLLQEASITSVSTHFNLSRLTSANYILSIFNENKLIQSFTIIINR